MTAIFPDSMESLAYASGSKPAASGSIKSTPDDFQVDELLGFDPATKEGSEYPHEWIQIEKTGVNTSYLAQLLAQATGHKLRDIGYSGMKDRHAITTQWFSVPSGGNKPIEACEAVLQKYLVGSAQQVKLLTSVAHPKKLKRGVHQKNRFRIRLRNLKNFDEAHLAEIKRNGVPNYFAGQRFGKQFANLSNAEVMFTKNPRRVNRDQRGIYLSAARSFLFNQIVSARLSRNTWLQPLDFEPMNLNASGSIFVSDPKDNEVVARIVSGDVHTTGALWGSQSEDYNSTEIGHFENQVVSEWPSLRDGLVKFGLKAARRPLRVMLENFSWNIDGSSLELKFELTKGAYATSVLREIVDFTDDSIRTPLAGG